jgi:hypothetical protein
VENPRAGGGGGNGGGGGGGDGGGGGGDGGGGPVPPRSPRPPNEWSSSGFMRAMSQVMGQGIGDALKMRDSPASEKTRARVRDPDTFNGKDPDKLRTFLF